MTAVPGPGECPPWFGTVPPTSPGPPRVPARRPRRSRGLRERCATCGNVKRENCVFGISRLRWRGRRLGVSVAALIPSRRLSTINTWQVSTIPLSSPQQPALQTGDINSAIRLVSGLATPGTGERTGWGAAFENLTLWERVYRHLRDEILSNRLPPGSVLAEVALAAQLGVSRGPIREALGRLAAESLVDVRPRRGAVVSALSAKEFLEAYQVREALETLATRLATPRFEASHVAELERLMDEQEQLVRLHDVDGFFRSNATFHDLIVAESGNTTLIELHRQIVGHMGRYRTRSLALRGNLERSVTEHRAIVRAIADGDSDEAVRLMADHIRVPQRQLESAAEEEVVLLS